MTMTVTAMPCGAPVHDPCAQSFLPVPARSQTLSPEPSSPSSAVPFLSPSGRIRARIALKLRSDPIQDMLTAKSRFPLNFQLSPPRESRDSPGQSSHATQEDGRRHSHQCYPPCPRMYSVDAIGHPVPFLDHLIGNGKILIPK